MLDREGEEQGWRDDEGGSDTVESDETLSADELGEEEDEGAIQPT